MRKNGIPQLYYWLEFFYHCYFETRKFLNITFSDFCELYESIDNLYDKLENQAALENLNTRKTMYIILKFIFQKMTLFDKLLKIIMKGDSNIKQTLFSKEILSTFSIVLNVSINCLVKRLNFGESKDFDSLIEKDIEKEHFNVTTFMDSLIDIFKTLYLSGCDFKNFVTDGSFNMAFYESLNNKDSSFNVILSEFHKNIEECEKNNSLDIPDELLDPLTYQIIEDPCLLPGMVGFSDSEIFFDRSTILKQLLIKEENPYTRAPLTIKEFEEFNIKPNIVEKNSELKDKIMSWKK